MKKIEIVETTQANHRLTVTPDRVTIKFAPNSSEDERTQVQKFSMMINEEMGDVTQSWRGPISFFTRKGVPSVGVYMQKGKHNSEGQIRFEKPVADL